MEFAINKSRDYQIKINTNFEISFMVLAIYNINKKSCNNV